MSLEVIFQTAKDIVPYFLSKSWGPIAQVETPGKQWKQVKFIDLNKENQVGVYLNHVETKELYPFHSPDWAFLKSLGVILVYEYVVKARTLANFSVGVYQIAKALPGAIKNYHILKNEKSFTLSNFIKNELGNFKPAIGHFKQVGKGLILIAPSLYISPLYISVGLTACALYDPLSFIRMLHKMETWRQNKQNLSPLSEKEIEKLSAWNWTHAFLLGKIPFPKVCSMQLVGHTDEKVGGANRFSKIV